MSQRSDTKSKSVFPVSQINNPDVKTSLDNARGLLARKLPAHNLPAHNLQKKSFAQETEPLKSRPQNLIPRSTRFAKLPLNPPAGVKVVKAPAKLTLILRVKDRLPNGLHGLDAEMVSLDFCDELWISECLQGEPSRVEFVGFEDEIDPTDNLVTRALSLVGRTANVVVHKRIPTGAGLGGGSSDAGAILRWANFDDKERAAAELGVDVAFCIDGGRSHVTGFGNVVEPMNSNPIEVTLVTPPIHCSTADVYDSWQQLGCPQSSGSNDLEPAVLALVPELRAWRDKLGDDTGQQPHLAGSGSTWFVYGCFPGEGRVVARTVPPRY